MHQMVSKNILPGTSDICLLFNLLFVTLMEALRENPREVRIVKSSSFG